MIDNERQGDKDMCCRTRRNWRNRADCAERTLAGVACCHRMETERGPRSQKRFPKSRSHEKNCLLLGLSAKLFLVINERKSTINGFKHQWYVSINKTEKAKRLQVQPNSAAQMMLHTIQISAISLPCLL